MLRRFRRPFILISNLLLPSLRRQSSRQRHCVAVNTKEHTMTVSPVALRRQTERKPHPTARYWKKCDVEALFGLPFLDLVFQAAEIHRQNFNPREIQLSTLLSIKTGGCPEDCAYCPQSAHHNTNLGKEQMMDVDEIVEKAKIAQSRGASRFCMGAAWRGPKPKDVAVVSEIISAVKGLGMEVCGTFGMLEDGMAEDFKKAGLDYYNHTIFEFITEIEGNDLTVCAGGRYDGLVAYFGGPETAGFGFGLGVERLLLILEKQGVALPIENALDVYIAVLGQGANVKALELVQALRQQGFKAERDYLNRKLKAQFKSADVFAAKTLITLGESEVESGQVTVKNNQTREEVQVSLDAINQNFSEIFEKLGF